MTAASILALVESIERHGPQAPAALAFRSTLIRKGREAKAASGSDALNDLLREVAGRRRSRAH